MRKSEADTILLRWDSAEKIVHVDRSH